MTRQLRILSAGAGAGKTYSLSNAIVEVIKSGVPADQIMATTFTIKAAEELTERVRRRLLEQGDSESAVCILDGYVGTMNSVFGRLLREFAFEMGLSPVQTVLPEEEATTLFEAVVGEVIDAYYKQNAAVFRRLQMDEWTQTVRNIIQMARQNGMDPGAVRHCADSSWSRLDHDILPKPGAKAATLDAALKRILDFVCSRGPAVGDTTKATVKALERLQEIKAKWELEGELNWQEWAQISKVSPGAKSQEDFEPLIAAAAVHDRHPRLHEDMHDAIYALFYCAADAMNKYQEEKVKRGLVDFTDQEALALQLLDRPECQEALQDRLSHVFVDEFQDCSPLQLALISRLREIVQGSTWVGDVKQAIFGFRGTDPGLMTAAMDHVDDEFIEILANSRRSRASLVHFVNDVFVPTFETIGLTEEKVKLNPVRTDKDHQLAALETWIYPHSQNQEQDGESLARGIQELLESCSHLVEDKLSHALRPIRPNDVAILCRSNDECQRLADALGRLGIRATVGEKGLLSTPEAVLAVAAFRYLVDADDTLALAEILHFSSRAWSDGRWLEPWLQDEDPLTVFSGDPRVRALAEARDRVLNMSPTEVLDLALSTAKVYEMAMAWGDGDQRIANLDTLRHLAEQYEDRCAVNGIAATVGGFSLFLQEVKNSNDDLNRVADSHNENAVNILTYHRAKGLEWPVVILSSLHAGSERNGPPPVFNRITAITDANQEFDFEQPLLGRRLFYWPWPYGQQSRKVGLDTHVDELHELLEAKRRAREENARLMYVGMTRARDYLIFATRNPSKALWLRELRDESGVELISLPDENAARSLQDSGKAVGSVASSVRVLQVEHPCTLRILSTKDTSEGVCSSSEMEAYISGFAYVAKVDKGAKTSFQLAHFQPSKFVENLLQQNALPTAVVGQVVELGGRIPITGDVDMASLGDMVHVFLAADNVERPRVERITLAEELQNRFKIHVITTDAMVEAADRLARFVGGRYPNVTAIHREWPIHLRKGLQKASGWIDLALETPEGWILIDHKSFPGPAAQWVDKAKTYLAQLQIYAHALKIATQKPVLEGWIHFPIVGAAVGFSEKELDRPEFAG